jgi:hypothetical protein
MYINHGSNKKVRKTTKGWHICVEWKDGTTSWERLADLKESNPVEVSEYAAAKSLLDTPDFVWWAPQKEMYSWTLMVHGYLYYHSNHFFKLKCDPKLFRPLTRARAWLRSPLFSPLKLMTQTMWKYDDNKYEHQIMYFAAHAARKPPGPKNLLSEEDNQMFNKQWHAATIQSGDHASCHLARPWCICQQGCSQKVHGQ